MNFEDARRIMVDSQLRPNRVTNEGVLAAMGTLPREQFVPEAQRPVAYVDEDLAIAPGRYNMEPPQEYLDYEMQSCNDCSPKMVLTAISICQPLTRSSLLQAVINLSI